jgi:hypothetical protein
MMVEAMFQTNLFEHLVDLLAHLIAFATLDFEWKGDVFEYRPARQEFEVLENDSQIAAQVRNATDTEAGNILAVDQDLTAGGSFSTVE